MITNNIYYFEGGRVAITSRIIFPTQADLASMKVEPTQAVEQLQVKAWFILSLFRFHIVQEDDSHVFSNKIKPVSRNLSRKSPLRSF